MKNTGVKIGAFGIALLGLIGASPMPGLAADPVAKGNSDKTSQPGSPSSGAAMPESKSPVAFIAQSSVRIYLSEPTVISLYNAMGQLLYHLESTRGLEVLPLDGINTGFLYLALHTGKNETTRKLVYTGK